MSKLTSLPRNGGYCASCGKTMHTQTRILIAHKPEADHIFCMWCGVRLPIMPSVRASGPCPKETLHECVASL